MNAEVRRRVELERELPSALDEDQFVLHYQPQLDLKSGRIVGAEALVRWMHPQRGLVPPLQFIGFAESSGLIEDIGRWALRAAVAQFVAWRAQGVEIDYVSVNVSARQFRNPAFTATVTERAAGIRDAGGRAAPGDHRERGDGQRGSQCEPRRPDRARHAARARRLRHRLLLARHLQRLPRRDGEARPGVHPYIEIERSTQAVVRAAIDMAHALGKSVVAEGVESEGQAALLTSMKCESRCRRSSSRNWCAPDSCTSPATPDRGRRP